MPRFGTPFATTSSATPTTGGARYGTSGEDTIAGTGGADALFGYGPPVGSSSNAYFAALLADKADAIDGGGGNDSIYGGGGNDTLYGGQGNDLIVGGYGADVMYGGSGADTFRFGPAAPFGPDNLKLDTAGDIIMDFNPREDHLHFGGMKVSGLRTEFRDGNTIVAWDGGEVTLAGAVSLHGYNFIM